MVNMYIPVVMDMSGRVDTNKVVRIKNIAMYRVRIDFEKCVIIVKPINETKK